MFLEEQINFSSFKKGLRGSVLKLGLNLGMFQDQWNRWWRKCFLFD